MGLGAFELLGALGQALLQFLEAGLGVGSVLLLGSQPLIHLLAGLAGLDELLFQLGTSDRLRFEGGRGLLGRGIGGEELLVLMLDMCPGALQVRRALTQALFQFVEARVGRGGSRRRGGSHRRQRLAKPFRGGRGRWLRCGRRDSGRRFRLGHRFVRDALEDVGDVLECEGIGPMSAVSPRM